MRTIYKFCFCMFMTSVLINERADVGKRSRFLLLDKMSEDGVGG